MSLPHLSDQNAFDAFAGLTSSITAVPGIRYALDRNGWSIEWGAPDQTAHADYGRHVLVLPYMGKKVAPEKYLVMRGYAIHELSHTQTTTQDFVTMMCKSPDLRKQLLNIIEDVKVNSYAFIHYGGSEAARALAAIWQSLLPELIKNQTANADPDPKVRLLNDLILVVNHLGNGAVPLASSTAIQDRLHEWVRRNIQDLDIGQRSELKTVQVCNKFETDFADVFAQKEPEQEQEQEQEQESDKPKPKPSGSGESEDKSDKPDEGEDGEGEGEDGEGEGEDGEGEGDGGGEGKGGGEGEGEGEGKDGNGEGKGDSDAESSGDGNGDGEGGEAEGTGDAKPTKPSKPKKQDSKPRPGTGQKPGQGQLDTKPKTIQELLDASSASVSDATPADYKDRPDNGLTPDEQQAASSVKQVRDFNDMDLSMCRKHEMAHGFAGNPHDDARADAARDYTAALRSRGARCSAVVRQAFAAKSRQGDLTGLDDGDLDPERMTDLALNPHTEAPYYKPGRVIHDRNTAVSVSIDGSSSMHGANSWQDIQSALDRATRARGLHPTATLDGTKSSDHAIILEVLKQAIPAAANNFLALPDAVHKGKSSLHHHCMMALKNITPTRFACAAGALAMHDALRGARVPHELNAFINDSHTVLKSFKSTQLNDLGQAFTKSGGLASGSTYADQSWKKALGSLCVQRQKRKVFIAMTDGGVDNPSGCQALIKSALNLGIEVYGVGMGDNSIKRLFPASKQETNVIIVGSGAELTDGLVALVKRILTSGVKARR